MVQAISSGALSTVDGTRSGRRQVFFDWMNRTRSYTSPPTGTRKTEPETDVVTTSRPG
jgi:hypothetical protein